MSPHRRDFLKTFVAGGAGISSLAAATSEATPRTIPIALVQFDAVPEKIERNLHEVERLTREAVAKGARWVMFHEGTVCDYTPRVKHLAEAVPDGMCTRQVERLTRELNCFVSFGLSEADNGLYHITQVFVGPQGFLYKYRKTWLWRTPHDQGYRDETVRYDPGSGPDRFFIDGVKATCFICADSGAPRCVERARDIAPQVVFFPNNRKMIPQFGDLARNIHAPLLISNRVGMSWIAPVEGGCVVYSADGEVLARANRDGKEEILRYDLKLAKS
jgi:predicted amidohydrolase